MIRLACILSLMGGAAALAEEGAIAVPSGRVVTLLDVIDDAPQGTYRFRFVAPDLKGSEDFDSAEGDMEFLCDTFALPRLPERAEADAQIVITLTDRPHPFGDIASDVVQFFEAYSAEDGTCEWKGLW